MGCLLKETSDFLTEISLGGPVPIKDLVQSLISQMKLKMFLFLKRKTKTFNEYENIIQQVS